MATWPNLSQTLKTGRVQYDDEPPASHEPRATSRIVVTLLGVGLIAAAVSKMLDADVSAANHFAEPLIGSVLVVFEIILGCWLLAGVRPILARGVGVATFGVFAVASGPSTWRGQASYGCLGLVTIPPVYLFVFDRLAVLALLATFPHYWLREVRRELHDVGLLVGGTALVAAVFLVAATACYGSLDRAIRIMAGEGVYLPERVIDFGEARPGATVEMHIEVRNPVVSAVRLIGSSSDCACVSTRDLPKTVEPGGRVAVPVRVTLPQATGAFRRRVTLMASGYPAGQLVCDLTGTITSSP